MAHGPWPTAHGDPAAIRRARGDDTGEEETREGAGGGLSQASRRSWSRPAHQLTYPTKPWERQPRQMVQPSADRYRPNRSASLRSFAGTTLSERVEKSLSSKREKDTETPKRYLSVPGFSARRCRAQVGLRTLGSSDHGPGTGSGEAVGKSGRFQFGTPSWVRFSLVTVAGTSSPLQPVPAQMGRGRLIDSES